jgi:mannan endo-1,4-beta-mannosidase
MIVGEYGSYTDQDTTSVVKTVFDTTVPRGIGRVVWQWDGSDRNDLTDSQVEGGGWEINDCANPTNLSPMGKIVWADNHAK